MTIEKEDKSADGQNIPHYAPSSPIPEVRSEVPQPEEEIKAAIVCKDEYMLPLVSKDAKTDPERVERNADI